MLLVNPCNRTIGEHPAISALIRLDRLGTLACGIRHGAGDKTTAKILITQNDDLRFIHTGEASREHLHALFPSGLWESVF